MSQLKDYVDDYLKSEYKGLGIISQTAINEISLYEHIESSKRLLMIKSLNRNDEVFRILKGIDTKGVLPNIYEVCSEEEALYILEEYVDGTVLASYNEPCDTKKIKKYMLGVCDALELLHSQGIIHRDIKPDNIIITEEDCACLIDLSIARLMSDSKSGDTTNLGTIGYAPPEQFGISSSQPTTDIYALGVMMNELILGVHPSINIPKGKIGRIIKKCTATQVSRRYQSIRELKSALSKIY